MKISKDDVRQNKFFKEAILKKDLNSSVSRIASDLCINFGGQASEYVDIVRKVIKEESRING